MRRLYMDRDTEEDDTESMRTKLPAFKSYDEHHS
jgi:hypothetical protein